MRSVNSLVVLGGVAALIAGSSQVSLAADPQKPSAAAAAKQHKKIDSKSPTVNEMGTRDDRGITIGAHNVVPASTPKTPPVVKVPAVPATKPLPIIPARPASSIVKSPNIKKPNTPTTAVKPATTKPAVNTSVVVTSKLPTGVIPVSTASTAPFITAWLDRPGNSPKYKVGDKMVVNVSSTVDCNVVVFNYDAKGNLTQIFPNDLQKEGRLRSGQTVQIGGDESPFDYHISGNGGTERIFVYAYPQSQNNAPVTVAMAPPRASSPFRTANNVSMDQYLSMVRNAQVFTTRGVEVVAKKTTKKVSSSSSENDPNKLELTFQVDANQ
jgi:hypothetical protein